MSFIYVLLVFCAFAVLHCQSIHHESVNEYCQWETFNATCNGPDEVIMIQSAQYGRMKFGRCMREDHGSVGCTADVLAYLDRLCSGRRTCQLTVPDATLHAMHQCPKEVMSYLQVSYTCISVQLGNKHSCAVYGGQPVRTESGYLPLSTPWSAHSTPGGGSSTGGSSSGQAFIGGPTCPWIIQVHRGQAINLTIINFNQQIVADKDTLTTGAAVGRVLLSPLDVPCASHKLVIQDRNRTVDVMLPCGGGATGRIGSFHTQRERLLYISDSDTLNIYLKPPLGGVGAASTAAAATTRSSAVGHHLHQYLYLLKFQVIGCPDINDINNAWTERRDDVTIVRCNFTSETYYLTCDDTRWKGDMSSCASSQPTRASQTVTVLRHQLYAPNPMPSHGLLIVIGLGVALGVAVGVFILFALIVCHRRRKSQRRRLVAADRLLIASLLPESRDESRDGRTTVLYAPAGYDVMSRRRASQYHLAPDGSEAQHPIVLCQCCQLRLHQNFATSSIATDVLQAYLASSHYGSLVTSGGCDSCGGEVYDGNVERLLWQLQASGGSEVGSQQNIASYGYQMSAVKSAVTEPDGGGCVPESAEAGTYLSADDELPAVTSFMALKPKAPFHDDVANDVTEGHPPPPAVIAGSDEVDLIRNAVGAWDQNMHALS